MKKKISVVIPTYNEEGNVKPLAEAIVTVMETELPQYRYEILFIDNHSKDRTRMYLRELCAKNKNIKAIFNARNFTIMSTGSWKSAHIRTTQSPVACFSP